MSRLPVKQLDLQTNGSIIIRDGLGQNVELPPGQNGTVLTVVSGVPAYQNHEDVIQVTAGEDIGLGRAIRILGGNAFLALATSTALSRVAGVSRQAALTGATLLVSTGEAKRQNVQFRTGLTLSNGDPVFLSDVDSGRFTNVEPSAPTRISLPLGFVTDQSAYIGTTDANSFAVVIFRVGVQQVIS